ncbi:MAG: DUF255 domain-containing protein [Saprospiraceae bacterium]|nr:DUF255 domain-containing protein [Saprospiraceae bacterium]
MKYTHFFILLVAPVCLFSKGIQFFEGTWQEALALAAKEEKVIFIDAFAEWCGPCKRMAANVFTDSEVGDFYNANFINMKIDMEKPENEAFSKQYPVAAFPTLYYIDFTGEVVQKITGAQDVMQFINSGKAVLNKFDRTDFYAAEYNKGSRDPQLVFQYVKALNRAGQPSLKISNDYLQTQKDLTTPQNLKFILEATTTADSRIFGLLVQYRSKIEAVTSKEAVQSRIQTACQATLDKAIAFESEDLLQEAQSNMQKHHPAAASNFYLESEMAFAKLIQDAKRYLKAWENYLKKVADENAQEQSLQALSLAQAFPKDSNCLVAAEKTAKKAATSEDAFLFQFNYAYILKQVGKTEEAKKWHRKPYLKLKQLVISEKFKL